MIYKERLLEILYRQHVSEKTSLAMEKNNTIVIKVAKDSNKLEIKAAVQKLFEVKVNHVRTLIMKGKMKRHRHRIGRRSNWKKAYITLQQGQQFNLSGLE